VLTGGAPTFSFGAASLLYKPFCCICWTFVRSTKIIAIFNRAKWTTFYWSNIHHLQRSSLFELVLLLSHKVPQPLQNFLTKNWWPRDCFHQTSHLIKSKINLPDGWSRFWQESTLDAFGCSGTWHWWSWLVGMPSEHCNRSIHVGRWLLTKKQLYTARIFPACKCCIIIGMY